MRLINNDCIAAMKEMEDNSVDSIVTDPPYELGFMGKSWDASGIAFKIEVWQQALRVLKPGGHLIAFSGSRTYHRMAVAIEDAGFQIRDQIMWVYGSGFPKSLNISKAIDKSAGAEREVVGKGAGYGHQDDKEIDQKYGFKADYNITAPATDAAKQWDGWGTTLKPAHEPMVLARKPLEGTVANNVLTYGTGGLNIDGSRVAHLSEADRASATPQGKVTSNKLAGSAPDIENAGRVDVERPDTSLGRFPANFIHDGSDEVVALFPSNVKGEIGRAGRTSAGEYDASNFKMGVVTETGFKDNGSAARFFYSAKASRKDRNEGLDGFGVKKNSKMFRTANNTSDTISQGFERFDTQPQANNHPTVKPTSLMQYLVRLITPGGGIVLDPFMGSGSTGKACAYEGFDFIGIDQSAEYVEIARARIAFAQADDE